MKGYYTKVVINRFWTGSGIRKEDFMENLGEDYRNKCYVYEVDKYINSIGYFVSVQMPNEIWQKIFDEEITYLFRNNSLYIVKRI